MNTARIFSNGGSQAVRLPKQFRFQTDEVIVQQLGDAVILVSKDALWETFLEGLHSFSDDIFPEGREEPKVPEDRSWP